MHVKAKYKNDLDELGLRLIESRAPQPDGSIAFKTVDMEFVASILESTIDFQRIIPEVDRRTLVRDALRATGREHKPGANAARNESKARGGDVS